MRLSPRFPLELSRIIAFDSSHGGARILRSTTLPVFCKKTNVTTYLPELFVTSTSFAYPCFFDLLPKALFKTLWQQLPQSTISGDPLEWALWADLLFEESICMHEATDDVNVLQYWAKFGVLPTRCAEYKCFHEVHGPILDSRGERLQLKNWGA